MNQWILCCLFALLQFPPLMASSRTHVRSLPGYSGDLPFKLETGYIGVGEFEEVQLFYLFVESQRNPSQDPLLFWMVGGPGCTGLSAFFLENGPLVFERSINPTGSISKLELSPFTWTKVLNVLYVDLPVGAGFSYSETQQGYYSSDTIWVDEAYGFLQKWFIDHPSFQTNPFYIGGGSYSGIPAAPLVLKVYEGYNKSSGTPLMNFTGYVLSSPATSYSGDASNRVEYAYRMALIPDKLYQSLKVHCNGDYSNINPNNTQCVSDYQTYSDLVRYINLDQILEGDCVAVPDMNQRILIQNSETTLESIQDPYQFWCRQYDYLLIQNWANDEQVREALGVRMGSVGPIERCNNSLAYIKDLQDVVKFHRNLTYTNLRALIFCADLDMTVPHFGTQRWIRSLNISVACPWRPWFVEGQVAGYTELRERNDEYYMTFATVKGAGHVAEEYKPKQVYHMIERWFAFSAF